MNPECDFKKYQLPSIGGKSWEKVLFKLLSFLGNQKKKFGGIILRFIKKSSYIQSYKATYTILSSYSSIF
jgi:hypothetical protein